MGQDKKTISPSEEHKSLQEYLMKDTPLNVALGQSGIFHLSEPFQLMFYLENELLLKHPELKEDLKVKDPGPDKDNKKSTITDIEKEFLVAAKTTEKWLVTSTTMTPGRQNVEKTLVKTIEKSMNVNYHIQDKGGFAMPTSPIRDDRDRH